jgi:uncharacterized membrane protein
MTDSGMSKHTSARFDPLALAGVLLLLALSALLVLPPTNGGYGWGVAAIAIGLIGWWMRRYERTEGLLSLLGFSVLTVGVTAVVLLLTGDTLLGAVVLVLTVSFLAYGMHRYELVETGLVAGESK